MDKYIFSSESVGEGHPDKVADTISDAVLDACLAQDKFSRVACETYVKSNTVIVGGEITTKAKLDFVKIARDSIREIGYVNDDDGVGLHIGFTGNATEFVLGEAGVKDGIGDRIGDFVRMTLADRFRGEDVLVHKAPKKSPRVAGCFAT